MRQHPILSYDVAQTTLHEHNAAGSARHAPRRLGQGLDPKTPMQTVRKARQPWTLPCNGEPRSDGSDAALCHTFGAAVIRNESEKNTISIQKQAGFLHFGTTNTWCVAPCVLECRSQAGREPATQLLFLLPRPRPRQGGQRGGRSGGSGQGRRSGRRSSRSSRSRSRSRTSGSRTWICRVDGDHNLRRRHHKERHHCIELENFYHHNKQQQTTTNNDKQRPHNNNITATTTTTTTTQRRRRRRRDNDNNNTTTQRRQRTPTTPNSSLCTALTGHERSGGNATNSSLLCCHSCFVLRLLVVSCQHAVVAIVVSHRLGWHGPTYLLLTCVLACLLACLLACSSLRLRCGVCCGCVAARRGCT